MTQFDGSPSPEKESERSVLRQLGPYLTLGIQLAATVVILFFIGRWLDGHLGSSPWCMIGATIIGISGGLYKFVSTALRLGKKQDEEWKTEKHNEKGS